MNLCLALFGPVKVFSAERSTVHKLQGQALVLTHGDGAGEVRLEPEGAITIRLPLSSSAHGMVVIEEDVSATLSRALRYAAWLLDKIDPTQRLTHCVLAVKITGEGGSTWRTQREQDASPNSFSMSMEKPSSVYLRPPHRPRAALVHQAKPLVDDLTALLRRECTKGQF